MSRNQKIILGALVAWHFVLLVLMLTRQLDFLFNDAAHRIGPGSDFWAIYNAGKHWLRGNEIYGQGPGFGFRYHPILAQTAVALLSTLKQQWAYWVWVAACEILFLSVMALLRKLCRSTRHFLIIATVLVFFTPYYLEVYMGNASFIAAALLLFAFQHYLRGGYRPFFFFYIASILVKPIGLLMLPILLAHRHYKLAVLTIVIVISLALPYFLSSPEGWHSFRSVNFEGYPTSPGFLVHGGNQGFHALAVRISAFAAAIPLTQLFSTGQLSWWNNILIRLIPYLLVLSAVILTIRLRDPAHTHLLLFIWSATYLLGYKDVWEHSYCFLIFGLTHLFLSERVDRRLLLVLSAGLALPTAFALYDITFYGGGLHDPDWHWNFMTSLIHHLSKPVWLAALFAVATLAGYRLRRCDQREVAAGRG
ncbi:MAG: hypothetical protein JSW34_02550 [Candidatus Zixiibacteriota bacterium]|nr:MAG: hypothetical protein JSW34_02550 [candidate division Zixibacteria bacterium]